MISHEEAFFRTDLNTEVTDAAFEAVDLPFLAILGDRNGIGRAAPAAHSAEDTLVDINFNSAPGNWGIRPLPLRVHERCRPPEQVLGHGFRHRKESHVLRLSPFCAADAGVEGKNDIRNIGNLRTLQDLDHSGNIAEGGHPHTEPL